MSQPPQPENLLYTNYDEADLLILLNFTDLRAHLGPLLATTSSAPATDAKPAASEGMNIDPAISGPTQQPQIPATASPHQPQPAPMGVQPVIHQVQMDVQQQHQQQQQHLQSQQQQQLQGQQPATPEGETPKKGNKRELSTSKRAAQNRAAQVRCAPSEMLVAVLIHVTACFPAAQGVLHQEIRRASSGVLYHTRELQCHQK